MSTKKQFLRNPLGVSIIIIFVIALATGSLYLIAEQSLKSSLKNVENDRNASMAILRQSVELANQFGDKIQKLFDNNNLNYKDADALYNDTIKLGRQ